MNLLTFLTAAVVVAAFAALAIHAFVTTIKSDGYGRRSPQGTAPRSHHPDPFDPRSRLA